jgi:hypothetical protein
LRYIFESEAILWFLENLIFVGASSYLGPAL